MATNIVRSDWTGIFWRATRAITQGGLRKGGNIRLSGRKMACVACDDQISQSRGHIQVLMSASWVEILTCSSFPSWFWARCFLAKRKLVELEGCWKRDVNISRSLSLCAERSWFVVCNDSNWPTTPVSLSSIPKTSDTIRMESRLTIGNVVCVPNASNYTVALL